MGFNPSSNSLVDDIKALAADLISECVKHGNTASDPEQKRLFALAATDFESGAMWAVKGVTYE